MVIAGILLSPLKTFPLEWVLEVRYVGALALAAALIAAISLLIRPS